MKLKKSELLEIQGGTLIGSVIELLGLIDELHLLGIRMLKYYFAKLTHICIL